MRSKGHQILSGIGRYSSELLASWTLATGMACRAHRFLSRFPNEPHTCTTTNPVSIRQQRPDWSLSFCCESDSVGETPGRSPHERGFHAFYVAADSRITLLGTASRYRLYVCGLPHRYLVPGPALWPASGTVAAGRSRSAVRVSAHIRL